MMFGVVLRVIGSKVGRKVVFEPFLAKKHGLTPWDLVKISNLLKLSVQVKGAEK